MSVSGGDLGEWVGPERPRDLAGVDDVELGRQLRAIAHELVRRWGQRQQPFVWHLPSPDPYLQPKLYRRGEVVELSASARPPIILARLDPAQRAALIAWLIAQDREEEAPGTT